jgi:hypothetical protein
MSISSQRLAFQDMSGNGSLSLSRQRDSNYPAKQDRKRNILSIVVVNQMTICKPMKQQRSVTKETLIRFRLPMQIPAIVIKFGL